MENYLVKIIPIFIIFGVGFLFRISRVIPVITGEILLKLVFYFTLPMLTFKAGATVNLTAEHLLLPLIAVGMVIVSFLVVWPIHQLFHLPRKTRGVFLVGTMIMNTGFTLPFVLAAFDDPGLAVYTIFDFGNTIMIFTFIYFFAVKYGSNGHQKIRVKKFILLPPIWGLLLGICCNIFTINVPSAINNTIYFIGEPTIFLIMLSLGIYFNPKLTNLPKVITVLTLRIGLGLLFGLLITCLLHLHGMIRTLIIVFCGAPVGYNTLVFSTLEDLDKEFAASIVSISILLGLLYVPLLLFYL